MNVQETNGKGDLVSIITPAYNAAPYLRETIATVQSQTYKRWEWLVVDDGSVDETLDIARQAARDDPRIRVLMGEGAKGLAARARNRAMSHARGAFFAFLDADDLWEPDKVRRQVQYLHDHPDADGVCCWHDLFGDEERVQREERMLSFFTRSICQRSELIRVIPFQTSTLLFRRHCYEGMGGMNEDPRLRSGQDFEYFARLIAAYRIHRMREILSHYRLGPPESSLYSSYLSVETAAGWNIFEVMQEKGFYTPLEARQKRGHLYYDQAKNNLFHLNAPFRGYLVRSILSGYPPLKGLVMFSMSFLPAPLLRKALMSMLSLVNWWTLRRVKEVQGS